jgi:hypothetical protein
MLFLFYFHCVSIGLKSNPDKSVDLRTVQKIKDMVSNPVRFKVKYYIGSTGN